MSKVIHMLQRISALPDSRTHDSYHSADELDYSAIKKKKRFHFAKNYNLSPSSKCEETEVNLITYILGYKFVQCQFLKLA